MARILVLGLGPGRGDGLTRRTWARLQEARRLYLRTRIHPTVADLPAHLELRSFDDLYRTATSFDEVYEGIVRALLEAAREEGEVLYAVPGHPLVGESTTRRLLKEGPAAGVEVEVWPALSFLDAVLPLVDLDPLEDGLQVVDALALAADEFEARRIDPARPLVVAQFYQPAVAAEATATLLALYPGEHPALLVRHAGDPPHERVDRLPLKDLSRRGDLDHLTTLVVPALSRLEGVRSAVTAEWIVRALRHPETGCPWDREQTHRSLRRYLLEEAYEVLEALDRDDPEALQEELGDLLLQILLHAEIARQAGEFDYADVLEGLNRKMIRRHPHVFGEVEVKDAEGVLRNWARIKAAEKGTEEGSSVLDGIPRALPALERARKLQGRAARVGFDWPDAEGVWAKVEEELAELRAAATPQARREELGDLLFALVNLARHLDLDPEEALREANRKFEARFRALEARAGDLSRLSLAEMDRIWEAVKEEGQEG